MHSVLQEAFIQSCSGGLSRTGADLKSALTIVGRLKLWDLRKHVERDIHAPTPNTYIESKMGGNGDSFVSLEQLALTFVCRGLRRAAEALHQRKGCGAQSLVLQLY